MEADLQQLISGASNWPHRDAPPAFSLSYGAFLTEFDNSHDGFRSTQITHKTPSLALSVSRSSCY